MSIISENKINNVKTQDKAFFHEASTYELLTLVNKTSIIEITEKYKQPSWCNYSGVLNGLAGCWSLMDIEGKRKLISVDFCKE